MMLVACMDACHEPAEQRATRGADSLPRLVVPSSSPHQGTLANWHWENGAGPQEKYFEAALCKDCHEDAYRMWQGSAHAHASLDNPWYRQSFFAFREARPGHEQQFCAGCHDPALLVEGALAEGGQNKDIDLEQESARAGVTCLVCHSAEKVSRDGNGSYVLSLQDPLIPVVGDQASMKAHRNRMRKEPLQQAELCGTCHRGFLSESMGNTTFLPGTDDLSPWMRSGYAGSKATRVDSPVAPATCQGCHMGETATKGREFGADGGMLASHRFLGGHTAMALALGDEEQMRETMRMLKQAATLTIPMVLVKKSDGTLIRYFEGERMRLRAGDDVWFYVVVRNTGVGHHFPGGTRDAQNTWVELRGTGRNGGVLFDSTLQEKESSALHEVHRLRAVFVDENGKEDLRHHPHHFRATAFDHTIGPRNASLIKYHVRIKNGAVVDVVATLKHQRHLPELHQAACEETKHARGLSLGLLGINACIEQPVTEIARARIATNGFTPKAHEESRASRFDAQYSLALGILNGLQEDVHELYPVLEAMERTAIDAKKRGFVSYLKARLAEREGQTELALKHADEAMQVLGETPALFRVKADALARVWRWSEAASLYALIAEATPLDDLSFRDAAKAYGSVMGKEQIAFSFAQSGLWLQPRDEQMLRSQFLAYEHMRQNLGTNLASGQPPIPNWHVLYRLPDALTEMRWECDETTPGCKEERQPVHVHELRWH